MMGGSRELGLNEGDLRGALENRTTKPTNNISSCYFFSRYFSSNWKQVMIRAESATIPGATGVKGHAQRPSGDTATLLDMGFESTTDIGTYP